MDPINYCEKLESEVIGWKAKVDDVIKKVDKMPSDHFIHR